MAVGSPLRIALTCRVATIGSPPIHDLRAAWPPSEPVDGSDHQRARLHDSRFIDALPLSGPGDGRSSAVAIAAGPGGLLMVAPVVSADGGWRRAEPGDGVAAYLVRQLAVAQPSIPAFAWHRLAEIPATDTDEHAIEVDQTNQSVIVGGRLIVKWMLEPGARGDHGVRLTAHLGEVGFAEIPRPFGWLGWQSAGARPTVVARVDGFLPGAVDGWTWCVDAVVAHLAHDPTACPPDCQAGFAEDLGRLVGRLHVALATPSTTIPDPWHDVDRRTIETWRTAAVARLAEALRETPPDGAAPALVSMAGRMQASIDALSALDATGVMPIHGDLHVGQILRWEGGLSIIDFDGNPIVAGELSTERQPAARDVAQMTCSLEHVARIADRRTEGARAPGIASWLASARGGFLDSYQAELAVAGHGDLFDARLLRPFEVEQECRELIYAARVLPRWRHAPLATLRSWFTT